MRFTSVFIFACFLLGSASALAIQRQDGSNSLSAVNNTPKLRSTSQSQTNPHISTNVLERRAKGKAKVKPPPAKITFGPQARKKLDDLNLHGKARKSVKQWHKSKVKAHMKTLGATHATIDHLAHGKAAKVDKNIHITGTFQKERKTKKGGTIKDPIKNTWNKGPNHHIYANSKDRTKGEEALHPVYKNAVIAKQLREGKTTVEFRRSD